jgi:hypothetical protein
MQLTVQSMMSGAEAPIPFAELVEVTEVTFSVARAIATGKAVSLDKLGTPLATVEV